MKHTRILVAAIAAAALSVAVATPASASTVAIAKCAVGTKSTGTVQGLLLPTQAQTKELFGECGWVNARVTYTLGYAATGIYTSGWARSATYAITTSYPSTIAGTHGSDRSARFGSFH